MTAFSNDKYESTGEVIQRGSQTLYRIRAKRDFAGVKAGDVGGWIANEDNLAIDGNAWVYGDAQVSGNAQVFGDARVSGNAWLFGNAQVYGDARVFGDAHVYGYACVYGYALVYGDARLSTPILMATRSDNYAFVCAPTPDGPRIMAGCRYLSFDEARDHWKNTRGGTQLGDESLAIVDFLERMAAIRGFSSPTAQEAAE